MTHEQRATRIWARMRDSALSSGVHIKTIVSMLEEVDAVQVEKEERVAELKRDIANLRAVVARRDCKIERLLGGDGTSEEPEVAVSGCEPV